MILDQGWGLKIMLLDCRPQFELQRLRLFFPCNISAFIANFQINNKETLAHSIFTHFHKREDKLFICLFLNHPSPTAKGTTL